MLLWIDHVGIACRDLASKIAFYESAFGLTVVCQETNAEQGVTEAMLAVGPGPAGGGLGWPGGTGGTGGPGGPGGTDGPGGTRGSPSYVQLLEPLGPDTPVGRFIARRGEGIHHVGYRVADIGAALAAISARGIRLIDARPRHGSMGATIAFLHPGDVGGVLTELVQEARQDGREYDGTE